MQKHRNNVTTLTSDKKNYLLFITVALMPTVIFFLTGSVMDGTNPVSYTHLDVYKRQHLLRIFKTLYNFSGIYSCIVPLF